MYRLILFIPLFLSFNWGYSQLRGIKVVQYEDCKEIDWVNVDSIASMDKFAGITLFIFRAEGSKHDGLDLITPLSDYLVPFDSAIIRIFSFELKNARYSGSCRFKVKVNGKEVISKGSPPFAYIVADNPIDQLYLLSRYNFRIANADSNTLMLNSTYQTHGQFYEQINEFIGGYSTVTHFENRIHALNEQLSFLRKEYSSNKAAEKFISVTAAPDGLNATKLNVFRSFGDTMVLSQVRSSNMLFSVDFYLFKKGKNSFGCGLDIGLHQFVLNADMNDDLSIIDTINKSAFDGNDTYTRVAYAKNISERQEVQRSIIGGHINFKFEPNPKFIFDLNLGIRASQISSSKYYFNSGNVSFGGVYPQYNSKDTMFSGSEIFRQNISLSSNSQELHTNQVIMSLAFNARISVAPFSKATKFGKDCYLFLGFFSENSGPLMKNEINEKSSLGNSASETQSLLYRFGAAGMNNYGMTLGLNYRIR